MAEAGQELVRLGHLILDGTPAQDIDPWEVIVEGQVDVAYVDACRVARAQLSE